jgi:hypothetical protein
MVSDRFQELVLDASDVCQSCYRRIRVERVDPTRSGMATEYEQRLGRHERTTEIAYGPAESVTDQKGVFCSQCGTESAFDRVWTPADVHDPASTLDRDRFIMMAMNCLNSLEAKGLSLERQTFVARALTELDDGWSPDEALSRATDHALAVGATGEADA